jgi:exodeoxyribonuclease V beta subunit
MFKNNLAYEASAGSGKTFMLVVRYLSLLFKGAEPSKILALTFTNKAASEMSNRVVETLEDLQNRDELKEIVKVTQMSAVEILEKKEKVLEEFLNAHTKIMTIDSFFTQILRKFSLYASLMPDFSTFASQHELKLMSRFLVEVRAANKQETLVQLSLQSKKRFTDIFALLDEFYTKKEELAHLQFTKKETQKYIEGATFAFEQIQKRIQGCDKASATVLKAVSADNFEDICAKTWLGRETLDYRTFSKCFSPELDTYLETLQENLKEFYRAKEQNFFFALSELSALYKKSKKALYMNESELSFSDVTSLVYEILHLLDDSEFLYFRLDAQIEHMLLDEFQDTSVLQYEILKPLIQEITSGNGIFDEGSFFFVGDVKQSIYRFRGGVSALFSEVAKQNATEVQKLLVNYRSQKEVVEFVNKVFLEKINNYTAQKVKEGADGGYVEVLQTQELIQEALTQVKKLIDLGANMDQIAILCATNGDGEAIKLALEEQSIEVVTETTTHLINQKSVQAVIEYLKYLYFKEDIYRHNFFALITQESEQLHFIDFNTTKLVDIVKNIINKYGLFTKEFHLVRFISTIASFKDIEAFLFEYERIDTAAAASDLRGVRVLTVHKSKGLEYEHVIVLDRLKRKPAPSNMIIYEYDGIALNNIYLRAKGRDTLDDKYALAMEKEAKLVHEDTLNALYVAFTRARENLFVIKKEKDSVFDILELEPASYGTLVCKVEKEEQQKQMKKLQYQALYYGTQSDILALEHEEDVDLDAVNFGLALHYMLEMLGSFEQISIANAYAMMINKYGYLLEEEKYKEIYKRVQALLENKEFLSLTQGEQFKEKALRYKNNLRYIDLLVKGENGEWIVFDYKSSLAFSEQHLKQVRAYIQAVREITGAKVSGYLVYLLQEGTKLVKV